MTDRIHIRDLLLRGIVGINDEERRNRQDILINITLDADTRPAGRSDAIEDAVNYRTITKRVIRMVEASRFYLVERLAAEIAAISMADPRVEAARKRLRSRRALAVRATWPRRRDRADGAELHRHLGGRTSDAVRRTCNGSSAEELASEVAAPVFMTVGMATNPTFLNAALLIRTPLSAEDLKAGPLREVERGLGRVRTADKNAPRTIDLDIALYNYDVLDVGGRHVPAPDLLTRAHIAVPLADLAPYYVHPETGETLEEIAARLLAEGIVPRADLDL